MYNVSSGKLWHRNYIIVNPLCLSLEGKLLGFGRAFTWKAWGSWLLLHTWTMECTCMYTEQVDIFSTGHHIGIFKNSQLTWCIYSLEQKHGLKESVKFCKFEVLCIMAKRIFGKSGSQINILIVTKTSNLQGNLALRKSPTLSGEQKEKNSDTAILGSNTQ